MNIIASMGRLGRREMLIIAVSLCIRLGLVLTSNQIDHVVEGQPMLQDGIPEVLRQAPKAIQQIFGSAITSGGLCALVLNLVLPQNQS